jgi:Domain of unknown function (DUF4149)
MTADPARPSIAAMAAGNAALVAVTAWVGSLWGVGFLAVPVLFYAQPDKVLAGMLAGHMFTLVAYAGMACGSYLLIYLAARFRRQALREPLFLIVCAMLLLVLASEFALQPQMAALKALAHPLDVMHSVYAGRFDMLHKIATTLYIAKSLLGAALVIRSKTLLIFRRA